MQLFFVIFMLFCCYSLVCHSLVLFCVIFLCVMLCHSLVSFRVIFLCVILCHSIMCVFVSLCFISKCHSVSLCKVNVVLFPTGNAHNVIPRAVCTISGINNVIRQICAEIRQIFVVATFGKRYQVSNL